MKYTLLVITLVALSSATQLADMKTRLADLGEHPFGKSMVNLVTVNMKTGGALTELK